MKIFYIFSVCFFGFLTTISSEESVNPGCLEKEKALALLETAETLLTKARVSFPSCKEDINITNETECAGKKPLAYIEISKKLISDVRKKFPTCSQPIVKDEKIVEDVKRSDCSEIFESGHQKSGIYTIWTNDSFTTGKSLQVYCDMETDKGGWTVIQRRGKFPAQVDFDRDWENYKSGFGNKSEEFWLGNENIRVLCNKGCEIRFDLRDKNGKKGFAHYQNFSLSSSNYRLNISGYTGNTSDDMSRHNNKDFATKDKGLTEELTKLYKSGWWHYQAYYTFPNLNGMYKPGSSNTDNVFWFGWRKYDNLESVEIKIRPKSKSISF